MSHFVYFSSKIKQSLSLEHVQKEKGEIFPYQWYSLKQICYLVLSISAKNFQLEMIILQ